MSTGGENAITSIVYNTPQRGVDTVVVTLWGVPGDPSHDPQRKGVDCPGGGCSLTGITVKPFLTLPTQCAGPLKFTVRMNEWLQEKRHGRRELPHA